MLADLTSTHFTLQIPKLKSWQIIQSLTKWEKISKSHLKAEENPSSYGDTGQYLKMPKLSHVYRPVAALGKHRAFSFRILSSSGNRASISQQLSAGEGFWILRKPVSLVVGSFRWDVLTDCITGGGSFRMDVPTDCICTLLFSLLSADQSFGVCFSWICALFFLQGCRFVLSSPLLSTASLSVDVCVPPYVCSNMCLYSGVCASRTACHIVNR